MTNEQRNEYNRILNNAAVINPKNYSTTTTKPVAKELLLIPMIFNSGQTYKFKAKGRGLGVFEMTLTEY